MKNILRIINLKDDIKFDKKLSLEEYGFIYYLKVNRPEINMNSLLDDLSMDMDKFKNFIEKLTELKTIEINIITSEYINVIWEIIFLSQVYKKKEFDNKYEKIFILNKEQRSSLAQIEDNKELSMRLFKIFQDTKQKYELEEYLTINNEDDYKTYLKEASPFSIFLNNQITPQIKEVNLVFSLVHEKNIEVEVINFLIDYVISTSIFGNFSIEYFLKILTNWQKNNINSLEKAMEFIKKKKANNKNSNYVEPKWEDVEEENVEKDLEEIKKLLKKIE